MTRNLLITVLILFSTISLAQDDLGEKDEKSIREVINLYFDGTKNGQPEKVEMAFLPSLEIQWIDSEGKFKRRQAKEYIGNIVKDKFTPRYGRIIDIDITHNIASAKVEIDWEKRVYTDYILLIKVESKWKIANKIATWVDKPKSHLVR